MIAETIVSNTRRGAPYHALDIWAGANSVMLLDGHRESYLASCWASGVLLLSPELSGVVAQKGNLSSLESNDFVWYV